MALQGHGQKRDNEALGLPQNYLTHNHAPLPSQCVWLLAGATCDMSTPKKTDEWKTTRQQNGQREETVGSSSCQDPLHFSSGRGLIDLAVSHSYGWCLSTAFSVHLCIQGIIWHWGCTGGGGINIHLPIFLYFSWRIKTGKNKIK